MFAANLRNYVFMQNGRRLRDDRLSLLIALICSGLLLALGQRESVVALEGLAILGGCMLSLTVYFGTKTHTAHRGVLADRSKGGLLSRPVSRRFALLSAMSITLLAVLPEVGATVLDWRLRQSIMNVPVDRESIKRITRTIDDASRYRVRLPSSSLKDTVSALKQTSKIDPALSGEALKAGSAVAAASTLDIELPRDMQGKAFSSLPEAKGSKWSFYVIATNTGPDNYSTIGIARGPNAAKMELIDRPIPEYSEYGPAFLAVKGLTATLDGYRLKHVVFRDMVLIYHGGPLILDNVYFFHCRFQVDSNEDAWRLISAVTAGGWVQFFQGSRASGEQH